MMGSELEIIIDDKNYRMSAPAVEIVFDSKRALFKVRAFEHHFSHFGIEARKGRGGGRS